VTNKIICSPHFQTQQFSPSLNSYSSTLAAAVGCPKCADRDRSEQQELKELLAESERLVHDSNLLLAPTVQQPIAAWVRHRKAKEQLNFRKESVSFQTFSSQTWFSFLPVFSKYFTVPFPFIGCGHNYFFVSLQQG
jgi:hypothetical protein